MLRLCLAVAVSVAAVSAAFSQSDPIAARRDAMRAVSSATRDGAAIAEGRAPFDAAKVRSIFETYSRSAKAMPQLFPEDSRSGGQTRAAARIWEDRPGFTAALAKFDKDAVQAAADSKEVASFRAAFDRVAANCTSCHEAYRTRR
ncbi:c-type cytochrome [Bosea caraganae]|nr:cytochrome c [Bosea caraganae]